MDSPERGVVLRQINIFPVLNENVPAKTPESGIRAPFKPANLLYRTIIKLASHYITHLHRLPTRTALFMDQWKEFRVFLAVQFRLINRSIVDVTDSCWHCLTVAQHNIIIVLFLVMNCTYRPRTRYIYYQTFCSVHNRNESVLFSTSSASLRSLSLAKFEKVFGPKYVITFGIYM